jgi:spore germination protein
VLLGRLGADEAQRRGLAATPPFQPAKNNGQGHCRYFPETQHNVCSSFIDYWQSHGLDLSDAGNSYRESLALFGLPISEPFSDTQAGVTVQYFERAIFEYHPENKGTPFEILLSLLGNQVLKNRGWQ